MIRLRTHIDQQKGLETLANMVPGGIMVEVGSYAGESTEIFAKTGKFEKIYAVDPWQAGYDNNDLLSRHSKCMEEAEITFDNIARQYPCIHKIKQTSIEAAQLFSDGSLDLVYLDACHKYEYTSEDIPIWITKIKKETGWFAGHDIRWAGVRQAVFEILGEPHYYFVDSSWAFELCKLT